MNRFFKFVLIFFLISLSVSGQKLQVDAKKLSTHIDYLASETLKGRYPGTQEDKFAAEYIRDQFQKSGLQLPFDKGLQSFFFLKGLEMGSNNTFIADGISMDIGTDFTPLSFSANKSLQAQVVYLGYGIRVDHEQFRWDDYHGQDVTGKWVLIIRGKPPVHNYARILDPITEDFGKAVFAKDMGALGVIFVNSQDDQEEDSLLPLNGSTGDAGIPVIQVTRETADKLLSRSNETIVSLEEYHSKHNRPKSFHLLQSVNATTDLQESKIETFNVVGIIRGRAPVARDEYIVIGAHYDHLGMGGSGTGSRRPYDSLPHVGADDNASGVSAMLEIAATLSAEMKTTQRSFIFVAFGAEEKGLLGSKHFVNNPPVPLSRIKLMVNLDMIGRIRENNTIQLGGTGTAGEMEELIQETFKNHNLELALFPEGLGPSDHASFYGQDIPVLFFSTGPHMDYHTPEDTPDKINYKGMKLISEAVLDLLVRASKADQKFTFTEAGPKISASRHGQERKVSLGLMPDFTAQGIEGLRADLIIRGKAADRGGMKNGDIITAINGLPVRNIEEYMYRLSQLEPGQSIHVEVLRNEEKEILLIILE
jgi:aminopeptidase YwaD